MYKTHFNPFRRAQEIVLRLLLQGTESNLRAPIAGLVGDHISDEIRIRGVYDADLLAFLEDRVFPGIGSSSLTCWDVGGNIGNHALCFARHFAQVEVFEPGTRAAAILEANLKINRIENVTLHRIGLSDYQGESDLLVGRRNLGASRLAETSTETKPLGGIVEQESVSLVRADDIGLDTSSIGFIKIDVEGHELKVLRGMMRTLQKHQPLLLVEHLSESIRNGNSEVTSLMRDLGYLPFAFQRCRKIRSQLVDNIVSVFRGSVDYSLTAIERFEQRDYPWVFYIHQDKALKSNWPW